jgi:hypothetical protein
MKTIELLPVEIQGTIEKLGLRIHDRFPASGLIGICRTLHDIAVQVDATVAWISRPNYLLRAVVYSLIAVLGAVILGSIAWVRIEAEGFGLKDLVQTSEAALNEAILIGAGIFFLITLENRRKRKRVIGAISTLKCLAHVIDAHQLTKDPDGVSQLALPTAHSPRRALSEYELGRYLDYCAELLSLTSKVGFLYVQRFNDTAANGAANELELLTSGISNKVWQKIIVLRLREKAE